VYNNSRSAPLAKKVFANNKNKSTTPKASNKSTPPNMSTQVIKNESIDYNIIEDMKRARANISIFELTKITRK